MAMDKVSKQSLVALYSAELNETVEHDIEHANRIFAYKHNHGWELKDPNYELQNGNITKRDTKKAQGADKS